MSSIFSSSNSTYNTSKRSFSPYPNSSKPLASTYTVLQRLLGHFYNKIIKWSKLLVPIRCWWNLIITHTVKNTYFVSIGFPTIPMICLRFHHYWKTLLRNKISFVFYHSNGFLESFNYTTKLQKQHSPTFSKHNAYQSTLNLFEPQTFELFFKVFQHMN
jgi:hypothetical protein